MGLTLVTTGVGLSVCKGFINIFCKKATGFHKQANLFELNELLNVQLKKISTLPHRREWNFLRGGGFFKTKPKNASSLIGIFRGAGKGVLKKWGSYGYFLELHSKKNFHLDVQTSKGKLS